MKRNTRRSIRVAAILIGAAVAGLWIGSIGTAARERPRFGAPSLQGSFALVGNGGANEAASVGVTVFDGVGNATRSLVLNEADPDSSGRLILRIPATGSYQVNDDGTGEAVFVNELPDGSKVPFNFDFVVTEAERGRGGALEVLTATKLHMVQREAGIAAKLVVFDLTRLPD